MIKDLKAQLNFWRLNAQSLIRKIRLGYRINKLDVAHLQKRVNRPHTWYGSSYGGFYIDPTLMSEKSIVYSFGIGKDVTFDMACIRKHGCAVIGFDPTPKSIDFIKSKSISDKFQFFNYGISTISGDQKFYLPADSRGVSGSLVMSEAVDEKNAIMVQMKTFADIIAEFGHTSIDVLKMDIEGVEYDVLENIIQSGVPIKQILVEFHDRLFHPTEFRSKQIVELMRQKGYEIFASSMSFEEVSFMYQDVAK